jgi:bacteriocin-like protein
MSEIRELTDDELDAVNGGAVDSFCRAGGDIGQYQTGGSGDRKAGE